jgi:ABC-type transport system involved in multi-copper enzyme maturation permease subunit
MWRYTQEISIVVFALLCVAVLALIALVISRAVKHKKTPVVVYILLAVLAVVLGCVIFATVVAGNPHPIAPPA